MKKYIPISMLAACLVMATSAKAATIGSMDYNSGTLAYFGSGNPNGSWTGATATDVTGNEVSAEIRFKQRSTPNMYNDGAGLFTFGLGTNVNLEFSLNSGENWLSNYSYQLFIDIDPTQGITYAPAVNPALFWSDNSFAIDTTLNGGGIEGTFGALGGSNTFFQNSQRDIWLGWNNGIDATYGVALEIRDTNGVIARTEATLQYGSGGAPSSVPDGGSTFALLGGVLGALGLARKFC